MIFDTHAHYDSEQFDEDRETLLASMKEAGVGTIVNVAASYESCFEVPKLAEKYPFMYAAVGVHPDEVGDLNEETFARMKEQFKLDKVVAVGEIGLDYYWDNEPHGIQKKWFIRQLELARSCHKPVIIHSRDAAKDTYDIMTAQKAQEIGGVIHCYSYSAEMALDYVKMGFYIGIGGVVTFKNGKKMKEAAQAVPIDRILLETDSPYLAPEPNRGKRNSSLNIPYIAAQIAQIKGMEYEEVVNITNQNARRLFHINEQ